MKIASLILTTIALASASVLAVLPALMPVAAQVEHPQQAAIPVVPRQAGAPVITSMVLIPGPVDSDGVIRRWSIQGTVTDGNGATATMEGLWVELRGPAGINWNVSTVYSGRWAYNFFYGTKTVGYADPRPTVISATVRDRNGTQSAPVSVVLR